MELGRARERRRIQDEMRALALNVFLQGRRLLNHNSTVKSLTGFGTAAAADLFLKSKDVRFPLFNYFFLAIVENPCSRSYHDNNFSLNLRPTI